MPWRRGPRRPLFISLRLPRPRFLLNRHGPLLRGLLLIALIMTLGVLMGRHVQEITMRMAVEEAVDAITLTVDETLYAHLEEHGYTYTDFVTLERDNAGSIAAITTNMSRVNTLSAELVSRVITQTEDGMMKLRIPLGNLLGSVWLSGRGPDIPVRILMLATSHAELQNEFVDAGINQTKHKILLTVTVDVNVLLPWETVTTQVVTDVLVAETIIVGRVPDTYLNWAG